MRKLPALNTVLSFLFGGLVLCCLAATRLGGYLLFHSLAEIFTVVVAAGVFMVTWNTRRFTGEGFLSLIGIAYLHVAAIDLLYVLAYRGMGVFPLASADLSVQLWIAARLLQSVSLLIAGLCIGRRVPVNIIFPLYTLVTSVLLLSVLYWRIFPECFIAGEGLTPFKRGSEFLICFVLLAAMIAVFRHRRELDARVLQLLGFSIFATIVSELAFTLYTDVNDIEAMVGHLFKFISFYLIYKAVIESSLVKPYATMFRDIQRSEEALRQSEVRLRIILDEMADGIIVVDREGVVRYINPAAKALLGMRAGEAPSKPFAFPVQAGRRTELEVRREDGRRIRLRMSVVRTTWEGEPAYVISLPDVDESP